MRSLIVCFLFICTVCQVSAQPILTLDQCHELAQQLSPLQQELLFRETIEQLDGANISKRDYPQLRLIAQATYQLDVLPYLAERLVLKIPLSLRSSTRIFWMSIGISTVDATVITYK